MGVDCGSDPAGTVGVGSGPRLKATVSSFVISGAPSIQKDGSGLLVEEMGKSDLSLPVVERSSNPVKKLRFPLLSAGRKRFLSRKCNSSGEVSRQEGGGQKMLWRSSSALTHRSDRPLDLRGSFSSAGGDAVLTVILKSTSGQDVTVMYPSGRVVEGPWRRLIH